MDEGQQGQVADSRNFSWSELHDDGIMSTARSMRVF